jgi:hypothetical protein
VLYLVRAVYKFDYRLLVVKTTSKSDQWKIIDAVADIYSYTYIHIYMYVYIYTHTDRQREVDVILIKCTNVFLLHNTSWGRRKTPPTVSRSNLFSSLGNSIFTRKASRHNVGIFILEFVEFVAEQQNTQHSRKADIHLSNEEDKHFNLDTLWL